MTNFTKNMTIAAAALVVAAGVAGAQTIKAEVPFGFPGSRYGDADGCVPGEREPSLGWQPDLQGD